VKRPHTAGRLLSPEEADLWARVAQTVQPLAGKRHPAMAKAPVASLRSSTNPAPVKAAAPLAPTPVPPRSPERALDRHGLDAAWDRRLARGLVPPDFTLDLHGASLDAAHARLDHGLALAASQGARLVLLVTGRARPLDDHGHAGTHGRTERRGAIRAKFLDWLVAGPHAHRIAAVRPAHPRHGGAGAVYLVLRRSR